MTETNVVAEPTARRRQYSSCDLCRKSRVACNASQMQLGGLQSPGGSGISDLPRVRCTNCAKRSLDCTFNWVRTRGRRDAAAAKENSRPKRGRGHSALNPPHSTAASRTVSKVSTNPDLLAFHQNGITHPATTAGNVSSSYEGGFLSTSNLSRQVDAVELHNQLWIVFSEVFEPVLAQWLGPECSPYMVPSHMSGMNILQLAVSLDQENCTCDKGSDNRSSRAVRTHSCPNCDRSVQLALVASVHAFSLRWLPLITGNGANSHLLVPLGEQLWLNSRSRVLSVIDKVSYKTVLALYLFGLTPIYQGVAVDNVTAHTIGETAVDMALRHIHRLRVKRQDLQFSGTGLSWSTIGTDEVSPRSEQPLSDDFIHAENMFYWAGVVFDTSASMTRGSPSILCSGVLGFEEEPVFRLIKARTHLFHENTEEWRQNGFTPTNTTTLSIVHRASTWKGYVWKTIAALREAINYGHEESVITKVQILIREALKRFDLTFRPLLMVCEKHILFLDKEVRLCYYLLQLHYHMGLALLCTLASSIEREDLVPDFEIVRREAVHTIFNTITFGLNCHGTISKGAPPGSRLVSFISLDPYPHHVLASLELAMDILVVHFQQGTISNYAFESACQVAFDAIDELPQFLSSVKMCREALHRKLSKMGHSTAVQSTATDHCSASIADQETVERHCTARNVPFNDNRGTNTANRYSNRPETNEERYCSMYSSPSSVTEAGLNCLAQTLFSKAVSLSGSPLP